MVVYEVEIQPTSDFGTPLRGDTLFGHICWRIREEEELSPGNTKYELAKLLNSFEDNPFLVISDAFLNWGDSILIPKPSIPLHKLIPSDSMDSIDPKDWKKIQYIPWDKKSPIQLNSQIIKSIIQQPDLKKDLLYEYTREHNTINRLMGTTGEGFPPYSLRYLSFSENARLTLFIATTLSEGYIEELLAKTGQYGYGRDASVGLGKFQVLSIQRYQGSYTHSDSEQWTYTLSPCLPKESQIKDYFFEPESRLGKLGSLYSIYGNPFKNPILYASTGSVFYGNFQSIGSGMYTIGKGVKGISSYPEVVAQGATLAVPIKF